MPGHLRRRLAGQADALSALAVAFAAQALLVFTGVVLARSLGAEERGLLQLLILPTVVIHQLGTFGMPAAVTYFIARERSTGARLVASLKAPLELQTAALMAVNAAALLVLVDGRSGQAVTAGAIALLALPGWVCLSFGLAVLQGQQRLRVFNVLRALQLCGYGAGLGVMLVSGATSLVVAALVWTGSVFVAAAVVGVVAARGFAPEASDSVPSKRTLAWFGVRSLLGSVSPFDHLRLDQLVVGVFVGPAALGLYVVAQAFTNLPRFIAQSVGTVAFPKIAGTPERARRLIARYMALTALACGAVVSTFFVAADGLVALFFGAEFEGSASLLRILLVSAFLFGMRRLLGDCARGLGRPELGMAAEVAGWVAMAPALALLAPRWGAEGVAWSMVAASGVGLVVLGALMGWKVAEEDAEAGDAGHAGEVVADAA